MNKSRNNAIYYSKYDFPLFPVMDDVEEFKPFISSYEKLGLYYLEIDQYLPLRGNGSYSHAMIEYSVDNLLINDSDIKHVISKRIF